MRREAKVENGAVVSATGVSGVRYKRQIELSTDLSMEEKKNALATLNKTLALISDGELSDFRICTSPKQLNISLINDLDLELTLEPK